MRFLTYFFVYIFLSGLPILVLAQPNKTVQSINIDDEHIVTTTKPGVLCYSDPDNHVVIKAFLKAVDDLQTNEKFAYFDICVFKHNAEDIYGKIGKESKIVFTFEDNSTQELLFEETAKGKKTYGQNSISNHNSHFTLYSSFCKIDSSINHKIKAVRIYWNKSLFEDYKIKSPNFFTDSWANLE